MDLDLGLDVDLHASYVAGVAISRGARREAPAGNSRGRKAVVATHPKIERRGRGTSGPVNRSAAPSPPFLLRPPPSDNIRVMDSRYDVLLHALLSAYGARLKTVVLFGSRARGEASPHSDHDIFAVIEGLPSDALARAREVRMTLLDCLADLPGAMGLHARTPAEFEADLTPLYLDVCADGICLLGDDYFEPFRRRGLAALAASGMKRERVGWTLFWMLPGNGPKNWELTWEGYRELP